MKLKDILKSKGWTDEQITAAFADPNTIATLDEIFGSVTSERDALKARDEEWQRKLETEFNPAIAKAEKDAMAARRLAADVQEQLKIAKEYGYLDGEAEARAAQAAADAAARNDPSGYDPKRHPTYGDVEKFAEAEAQAIAMAHDISAEYSHLTGGKSLFEYEAMIGGRPMRGLSALREEAKASRKNLDLYVSEKFDFPGKRQAMTLKRQQEHDDAVRKEAEDRVRTEMAQKYGNPLLATPLPSSKPFMPKPTSGETKNPWDFTAQERRADRIRHAMENQAKSPVQ